MSIERENEHWLVRPRTICRLWITFSAVLALVVILQFVVKVKGYFGIDGWLGFAALFGFLCCVAMVLMAKGLGLLLKREETFYDD